MSQLELADRTLILHRFPQMREESPLQAWDAADEYLLQQTLPEGPILVFNDSFGALTCALNPRPVWHVSDSWLSQQATRQNLRLNELDDGEVRFLSSLDPLPAAPAAVLIKVPKTLALLEQQLRDYLGGFGFQGDKVSEVTARFSGGEKARLVLALIVWQRPNLLLLDEPTNHLDLDMRQALTEALIDFEGALVVVSHDRHLLRATTDDLYLVHDGKVDVFPGDLEDYQQWLSDLQKQQAQADAAPKQDNGNSAQARKDQKRREAELRTQTQPLRKEIEKLEKQMAKWQSQLTEAENQLADGDIYDPSRKADLTAALQRQAESKAALEEVEMAWLDAQEQLEAMLAS